MSFQITYRPLCKVNIWHGYYLHPDDFAGNTLSAVEQSNISGNASDTADYDILKDLSITHDSTTKRFMSGYKVVFRSTPVGFSLWVQAKKISATTFSPFVPFSEPLRLTFYLRVRNATFFNFTNLEDAGNYIYYFSNQANNSSDGTHYLNSSGTYAATNDRVPVRQQHYSIYVADLAQTKIRFVLANALSSDEIICEAESLLEKCELDWSSLPTGLYDLTAFDSSDAPITSLSGPLYLSNGELPSGTLAVIEIVHAPSADFSPYALLEQSADNMLLGPDYTLWWQNRITQWRYMFNKSQSAVLGSGGDVDFVVGSEQRQLVTRDRQPLISGYRPIRFQHDLGADTNEEILLPNPGTDTLYPENGNFYSEVYLGNVDINRV